jgi:hypothetical protein
MEIGKKKKNNVSSLHEESLIPKDYGPFVFFFFFFLTEYASILLSFNFEAWYHDWHSGSRLSFHRSSIPACYNYYFNFLKKKKEASLLLEANLVKQMSEKRVSCY